MTASVALWVDDDNNQEEGALRLLGRALRRKGVLLTLFSNRDDAEIFLQQAGRKGAAEISLLVDIMLPRDQSGGAINPHLGMSLAEFAAGWGVRRICFLTVIPQNDVQARYEKLQDIDDDLTTMYEDKMNLLEDGKIDRIAEFLKNSASR